MLAFNRLALIVFTAALIAAPGRAEPIGRATVIDGDTLEIDGETIGLWGIDAPELEQSCREPNGAPWPCGRHAKQLLSRLAEGRMVVCRVLSDGQFRMTRARCSADNRDLGWAMVAFGFALDDVRYSSGAYGSPQRQSANVQAGIWSGTFVTPWEWRNGKRLD
ncbi:MAG: thermonuclease family protein [Alphaproteobacteria bacterium]